MFKSFEEFDKKSNSCVECIEKKFNGKDGKRHILVCGGTGCLSSRSEEIIERFEALIAEKHLEDKVTVNKVGCFGFCSQGPFVKIFPEDTLYRMVKVEDTEEIIEKDNIEKLESIINEEGINKINTQILNNVKCLFQNECPR